VRAIIALTALVVSAAAAAESISSVEVTSLPAIGGDSAQTRIVAIDDRPVVLQPGAVRVLDASRKTWRESPWPEGLGTELPAFVTDGRQTFALRGNRVTQLVFNSDAPVLRALPNLPVALSSAVGVPADGHLYVAGVDANGASQFLQLAPVSEADQWTQAAAWPGGGVPTSLVARLGALYLTVDDRLLRWSSETG